MEKEIALPGKLTPVSCIATNIQGMDPDWLLLRLPISVILL